MIDRAEAWLRNLRRSLSRSEWSARRLDLAVSEATEAHAGLVLVHLSTLRLEELKSALAAGRLPFFNRLLEIEGYRLQSLASVACSAAEREARLFYGLRGEMPGPGVDDAAIDQKVAGEVEWQLAQRSPGLLEGGSQYGGIFSGAAADCHFCAVRPGWGTLFPARNPWLRAAVILGHGSCFFRAAAHRGLQYLLARDDSPLSRQAPPKAALSRELSIVGAAIDAARGLPIIHVNLDGHVNESRIPRGSTVYARMVLSDTERAVRSIWLAARRSARRDYDVWIYATPAISETGDSAPPSFLLLPADAPLAVVGDQPPSLLDLRDAALHVLGRAPLAAAARPTARPERNTLRVMTYNVHSCVGMDGKLSPARIARVIARCDPDVVALQELDVRRARTGTVDQAQAIADELKMEFHFHPALAMEEELYGDAVLSRYPLRLRRAAALPGLPAQTGIEPRGALWVTIDLGGQEIQLLNTHLGLVAQERMQQVSAILDADWLGHPACQGPTILCGDFNALPRSQVCRRISERLADAQLLLDGHRPKHTFFGRYPIGRIDHVFVSPDIEVVAVDVPRNDLVRRASDHLPLVVDVKLKTSR